MISDIKDKYTNDLTRNVPLFRLICFSTAVIFVTIFSDTHVYFNGEELAKIYKYNEPNRSITYQFFNLSIKEIFNWDDSIIATSHTSDFVIAFSIYLFAMTAHQNIEYLFFVKYVENSIKTEYTEEIKSIARDTLKENTTISNAISQKYKKKYDNSIQKLNRYSNACEALYCYLFFLIPMLISSLYDLITSALLLILIPILTILKFKFFISEVYPHYVFLKVFKHEDVDIKNAAQYS